MESGRVKQPSLKRKVIPHQNPELVTAQMTLGRTANPKVLPTAEQAPLDHKEVMDQAEELWLANDMLESINLMKGLLEYLRGVKFQEHQVLAQVHTNLAVSYYKIGFLEEANEEFSSALSMIKQGTIGMRSTNSTQKSQLFLGKQAQKLKSDMLTARIQLQVCILYSEMGKHETALEHARIVCKITYNMIYDLLILLYQHLHTFLGKNRNNYANAYAPDTELTCEGHEGIINNIAILEQLVSVTKDFRQQFISKQKCLLLEEQRYTIKRIGKLPSSVDMDLLYALIPENIESLWVYKNKILDEIQMKFVKEEVFDPKNVLENNEVIQKMVYLAISLYCYSTETRFLEKNNDKADPTEVLDSEHWLSRSLEIAYSFLPHQAPILNQILTVHDRFHGIDKQTIPEDKEIGGFFKVLRPLAKPKNTFSTKNIMCSPIMIRIQVPKMQNQPQQMEQEGGFQQAHSSTRVSKLHSNKIELANKTIDLDALTKNNKIRGLNQNSKKYDFLQTSQSTIRQKNNTKTDFTEHLKNIYTTRKIKSVAQHTKNDSMKINLAGISSHSESGVKSMRRPHSYDKEINKPEETYQIQTERKKKSVSLHRKDSHRRRSNTTSNSTTLKLDGLQMLPKKNIEDEECFEFSGRISNVETTKFGANIFINNNINLFISKQSKESGQAPKDLSTKNPGDRTVYEIGRRQNYMNKRKAHNSVFTGMKNPQFPV